MVTEDPITREVGSNDPEQEQTCKEASCSATCAKLAGKVPGSVRLVLDSKASCSNSLPLALRIKTQKAVIDAQSRLIGLIPSLIRSSSTEDTEESPLKRLFRVTQECIQKMLNVHDGDYRFDFTSSATDPRMELLREELLGHKRHIPQINFDSKTSLIKQDGLIQIPLKFGNGNSPIGFFSLPSNACFLEEKELRGFVDTIMFSIDTVLASLERKIQALTDPMTGLANRRLMEQEARILIDIAKRDGTPLSIFFLDADNFKYINDEYGHHVGDEAIKAIAKAIKGVTRSGDIVCRCGGEEFVIVTPADESASNTIAERLLRAIRTINIPTEKGNLGLTCSIGMHTEDPRTDSFSLASCLENADAAMYVAKHHHGKNCAVRSDNVVINPSQIAFHTFSNPKPTRLN